MARHPFQDEGPRMYARLIAAPALPALLLVMLSGCGLRNVGESCIAGPIGDFMCLPTRCDKDAKVCVECVGDGDCFLQDPWDRPKCIKGIPKSEGGDGLNFCKHVSDRGTCN